MGSMDWHGRSFTDIDPRLCTLCGMCISACPVDALGWVPAAAPDGRGGERIAFERAACVDCGLCYAVCPAENPGGATLPAPADSWFGPTAGWVRGYAADLQTRRQGSAGGVVTALLVSALESGAVDGALVVGKDPRDPTRPQAFVAHTVEEIRAAAQSKYCVVPVNAVLKNGKGQAERLAVVALPCQAHALRLAQGLGLAATRNVSLIVGLFCGFNLRYAGTAFLLGKLGFEASTVKYLEYRGGPWPGGFRAVTWDGRERLIPKHQYTYLHLLFAPQGCWYCPDLTAEHADISAGDYWKDGEQGFSMVVSRTPAGHALLAAAAAGGDVVLESISREEAVASHHHLLAYKKQGVQVRRRLAGVRPVRGYQLPPISSKESISAVVFYLLLRLGSYRPVQWAIGMLPQRLTGWASAGVRSLFRR